jgi:hypothetical protein
MVIEVAELSRLGLLLLFRFCPCISPPIGGECLLKTEGTHPAIRKE